MVSIPTISLSPCVPQPMWATVIFSLGATKPGPPRTCLGTIAKAVAAAPPVNMNLRRDNCRLRAELLGLCVFIGIGGLDSFKAFACTFQVSSLTFDQKQQSTLVLPSPIALT